MREDDERSAWLALALGLGLVNPNANANPNPNHALPLAVCLATGRSRRARLAARQTLVTHMAVELAASLSM